MGRSLTRRNFQTLANGDFQAKWLGWLKEGLLVVWLVFPEREREREENFPGLGIKFRLADRETSLTSPPLPPSRFLFLFGRFHGCCMATRWRSANFNDLFRGQAQPPEIRQSTLHGFCIPSSSRSLSLVVKFDDSGKKGREDFFFFLLFENHISLLFPLFSRGKGSKNYWRIVS